MPEPAFAANVANAAPEPAGADEAAPEDMADEDMADEDIAGEEVADVIADVEPAALLEPAAADVDDDADEAELPAADPELLLLQAARVRAAAAAITVAATRVLAFMGVLLDGGRAGIRPRRRTENICKRPDLDS